jgi:phage FluMu protein Com
MPITTKCPSCGQTIAAPDYAAGHKARCPHCKAVMQIPGPAAVVAAALAHEAQVHEAAASHAEALAMEARRSAAATATATEPGDIRLAPPPTPDRSSLRSNSRSGSSRSSTTIERIIAKTSPYGSLRTLASVAFGVGLLLTVLVFFGGVATMLVLAIDGKPVLGIGIFGGALVVAALLGVGSKAAHDVIRLLADIGDRSRQMSTMLEDLLNRPRDESF